MNALEIIVFIAVGVIVVGLITGFLTNWDMAKAARDINKLISGNNEKKPLTVDRAQFVAQLHEFWQNCSNESRSFYLNEPGLLTKASLFDEIKALSWCDSIQSAEFSCGGREDINMTEILLPKIITLKCADGVLYLS